MPSRRSRPVGTILQVGVVMAASLVVMATSPSRYETVPGWVIEGDRTFTVDDLGVRVWVARSGPGGVGFTVQLANCGSVPQTVRIVNATLVGIGQQGAAEELGDEMHIAPGEAQYRYLPFLRDERRNVDHSSGMKWQSDKNLRGTLTLSIGENGSSKQVLEVPLLFGERDYPTRYPPLGRHKEKDDSDSPICPVPVSDTDSVPPEITSDTGGQMPAAATLIDTDTVADSDTGADTETDEVRE